MSRRHERARRPRARRAVALVRQQAVAPDGASLGIGVDGAGSEEELVAQTAEAISRLRDESRLRYWLAVGELVLNAFYGGDFARYHERGSKEASLRKLAAHPQVRIAASSLDFAIRVYETLREQRGVSMWRHCSFAHCKAVLSAPLSSRHQLLEQADRQGWSVLRLEDEIRSVEGAPPRGAPKARKMAPSALEAAILAALRSVGELERHIKTCTANEDLEQSLKKLNAITQRLVLQVRHARAATANSSMSDRSIPATTDHQSARPSHGASAKTANPGPVAGGGVHILG